MDTVIKFIIIFGALVFFHELGHLMFAKRAGILCREFAIGFGPKLFSIRKKETLYTIRLLPLGGYVLMAGEDPEKLELKPGDRIGLLRNEKGEVDKIIMNGKEKFPDAKMVTVEEADIEHNMFIRAYDDDDQVATYPVSKTSFYVENGREVQIAPYDRQFASKPVWDRILTIFAGPAMNFILAFFILLAAGLIAGKPVDEAKIGKVVEDGPAAVAGLQKDDQVLSINGKDVEKWDEMTEIIREHPKESLTFTINRDGTEKDITVTPDERKNQDGELEGVIQVYAPTEFSVSHAIKFGAVETVQWTKLIFVALGDLFTGKVGIDQLSGPVGIYSYTDQAAQLGTVILLRWAAVLSINLGIFNLLPLPALDGGRLLFLFVEALRGKPVDKNKEGLFHFIGFALLFLLMIVVTWNDIQKFFL